MDHDGILRETRENPAGFPMETRRFPIAAAAGKSHMDLCKHTYSVWTNRKNYRTAAPDADDPGSIRNRKKSENEKNPGPERPLIAG